ncbi:MAG: hypothetical protein DSM106950_36710, partial [Stigonema ocellatum SAG 48.90 = DSM 106950]|nr:hypothetical protein [Stigonema ocellatum SAG 48.90 = DSM 106950]
CLFSCQWLCWVSFLNPTYGSTCLLYLYVYLVVSGCVGFRSSTQPTDIYRYHKCLTEPDISEAFLIIRLAQQAHIGHHSNSVSNK